jgi:nucleotide-binding universal stress UspA family protein
MFTHIAVAVDFASAADTLLDSLPRLRELGAERLTLIHVARLESPVGSWVSHLEYYRQKLEERRADLEREGFAVHTICLAGDPAEEIVRIARDRGASLVMVGSRSNTAVPGGFVGSVAWEIIRRTSLPVLVQRVEPEFEAAQPRSAPAWCSRQSHVLFPTDFSAASEAAFRCVEALARAGVASFSLLHVREDLVEPWLAGEEVQDCNRRLGELADRLRKAGAARIETQVLKGTPIDELLRFASGHENVLMVLGTHGRGWLAELLVGSVSREILRRAAASVLLVRVKPDDSGPASPGSFAPLESKRR